MFYRVSLEFGDAFSLLTRFEGKLEQYHGNLERGAIELSKEWRTDKILRHLEALLVVADESGKSVPAQHVDVPVQLPHAARRLIPFGAQHKYSPAL